MPLDASIALPVNLCYRIVYEMHALAPRKTHKAEVKILECYFKPQAKLVLGELPSFPTDITRTEFILARNFFRVPDKTRLVLMNIFQ